MKNAFAKMLPGNIQESLLCLKRDYLLKKTSLEWESFHKWEEVFQNHAVSQEELTDMMFYIEKPQAFGYRPTDPGTGNPFFSLQDTYQELEKRLSHTTKAIVHEVIVTHFQHWKTLINQSKHAQKIHNRPSLATAYLPHFYDRLKDLPSQPKNQIVNPCPAFVKKRKFSTYNEAWLQADQRPRFHNLRELLHTYDQIMRQTLIEHELIENIFKIEQYLQRPLILEANSDLYQQALHEGWIACEDPGLCQCLSKSNIWDTLGAPLLLHPQLEKTLRTLIQTKEPSIPFLWRLYDKLSDFLKAIHVSLSGFHYLTLLEESAKSSGWNFMRSYRRGGELLKNLTFMQEFIEYGGVIGHNPELISQLPTPLKPQKGLRAFLSRLEYLAQAPSRFLFGTFQPRLKVTAFFDMQHDYLRLLKKTGSSPDPEELKHIYQEIAALTNDMFGGQRFELWINPTPFKAFDFQDPIILKRWRRLGGYVDWTISALKEFLKTLRGFLELFPKVPKTPTGTLARRNFYRYARNLVIISQILNCFFTGFSNPFSWDLRKSHFSFSNQDALRNGVLDIQLPDLYFSWKGQKIALGRDPQGRKLYTHFGKKLLENFHYFQDPIRALYNKSNPILQIFFVQITGGTPTLEGIPLKEQQVYCEGIPQPWEGKQGLPSLLPRLKHLVRNILPYSMQNFEHRGFIPGLAQFFITAGGSLPVRKGLSLKSAEKLYAHYLEEEGKYARHLAKLDQSLADNGYSSAQIQRARLRAVRKTT